MSFQVFIRTLQNKLLAVDLSTSDSVKSIKDHIFNFEGIPTSIQRLVFQSKELSDKLAVIDTSIQKSDTIDLRLRLSGGGNSTSFTHSIAKTFEYKAHDRNVSALVVTNDDKHIVSGAKDGTVSVFDVESKKCVTEKIHRDEIATIAVTRDKRYIISRAFKRSAPLKIFDFNLKNCICEFPDIIATSLAVTHDDRHVVCGTSTGSVKIISIMKKRCVFTFKDILPYAIESVIVRGDLVICGTLTMKVLSISNRKCVKVIPDTSKSTKKFVDVSNPPRYLVQSGYDQCVNVYSFWSGKIIRRISKADNDTIQSVAISKNKRYLMLVNSKSVIKIFEISSGRRISKLDQEGSHYDDFPIMRPTNDNKHIVLSDWKGDIKILTLV